MNNTPLLTLSSLQINLAPLTESELFPGNRYTLVSNEVTSLLGFSSTLKEVLDKEYDDMTGRLRIMRTILPNVEYIQMVPAKVANVHDTHIFRMDLPFGEEVFLEVPGLGIARQVKRLGPLPEKDTVSSPYDHWIIYEAQETVNNYNLFPTGASDELISKMKHWELGKPKQVAFHQDGSPIIFTKGIKTDGPEVLLYDCGCSLTTVSSGGPLYYDSMVSENIQTDQGVFWIKVHPWFDKEQGKFGFEKALPNGGYHDDVYAWISTFSLGPLCGWTNGEMISYLGTTSGTSSIDIPKGVEQRRRPTASDPLPSTAEIADAAKQLMEILTGKGSGDIFGEGSDINSLFGDIEDFEEFEEQ